MTVSRITLAVFAIVAWSSTAPASAQSVKKQDVEEITAKGCLVLGPKGEYVIQRMGAVERPDAPTGTSGSVHQVPQVSTWKLTGGPELIGYLFQQVEVKGLVIADDSAPPAPVGTSGRSDAESDKPAFKLSVRTITTLFFPSCR